MLPCSSCCASDRRNCPKTKGNNKPLQHSQRLRADFLCLIPRRRSRMKIHGLVAGLARKACLAQAPHVLYLRVIPEIAAGAIDEVLLLCDPDELLGLGRGERQRLFRTERACRLPSQPSPWGSADGLACRCGLHRWQDQPAVHGTHRGCTPAPPDRVASTARIQHVSLNVRLDNDPAIRLYRKLGFKRVGRINDYYEDCAPGQGMRRASTLLAGLSALKSAPKKSRQPGRSLTRFASSIWIPIFTDIAPCRIRQSRRGRIRDLPTTRQPETVNSTPLLGSNSPILPYESALEALRPLGGEGSGRALFAATQ